MKSALAAVIPCFDAGDRVIGVVDSVIPLLDRVIVVDDGSTDGLRQRLRGKNVVLAGFPSNRGKGHALLRGFEEACKSDGITAVVTVDADGQHHAADIAALYSVFVKEGADLVIGSRLFDNREVPWRSRFGNTLTISAASLLLGRRLPDTQSGFRLHSMRFVRHVLASVRGGRYETEMEILVRAVQDHFKVVPVPIRTIYENGNRSSHFNVLRDSTLIWGKLLAKCVVSGRRRQGASPK